MLNFTFNIIPFQQSYQTHDTVLCYLSDQTPSCSSKILTSYFRVSCGCLSCLVFIMLLLSTPVFYYYYYYYYFIYLFISLTYLLLLLLFFRPCVNRFFSCWHPSPWTTPSCFSPRWQTFGTKDEDVSYLGPTTLGVSQWLPRIRLL